MARHITTAVRDACFEIEHISGLRAALGRTRRRFDGVNEHPPLERVEAFRRAVEATRDDYDQTIERINRWWRAWDRACHKLVRVWLVPKEKRWLP